MPNYKVTTIQANANNTVQFYTTTNASLVLMRSFGKVRNIRASDDREEIVISETPEAEFRFDVWNLVSLGSTSYTPISPTDPNANALYRARFNEIYATLSTRFFFGCCPCDGGDGSSVSSFTYEWNSGLAAGDFYFTSGLLIMSQQSDLAQDLSGLLAEMEDGSLITFISQDDPTQFVVYEVSDYSLLSGLVFYSATIVAGDSVGFADTTIYNTTFDKVGAGGSAPVWGTITGTIEDQLDLLAVVQDSEWTYLPVTGTNTLVGGLTPAITAYQEGQVFLMKPQNTNTGSVTLNIDGLGTDTVTHAGNALSAGVIKQNAWYFVARTATNFELVGEAVLTQMSVTQDGLGIKLVNDEATPDQQYHYGTDDAGTKGWQQNFVTWDSVLANVYNPISSPNPSLTTGFQNTFYGIGIANPITSGQRNTAVGANLLALTTGASNTAVGYANLINLTTNQFNTVVGTLNLYNNGYGNVIMGYGNMNDPSQAGTSGSYNVIMGDGSLILCTGWENVAFGISVMVNATTAYRNIAIGYQAGTSITTGDTNIIIGDRANAAATANDQIVIGRQVTATGTGLWIGHIQNAAGPQALYYDPATNQVTYNPAGGGSGDFIPYNAADQTTDIQGSFDVDPTAGMSFVVTNGGQTSTRDLQDGVIQDTVTDGTSGSAVSVGPGQVVLNSSDTASGDLASISTGVPGAAPVAQMSTNIGGTAIGVEISDIIAIVTPAVAGMSAVAGQVLTLIDAVNGEAEWQNAAATPSLQDVTDVSQIVEKAAEQEFARYVNSDEPTSIIRIINTDDGFTRIVWESTGSTLYIGTDGNIVFSNGSVITSLGASYGASTSNLSLPATDSAQTLVASVNGVNADSAGNVALTTAPGIRVIAAQNTTSYNLTGTVTNSVIASLLIPAGSMGPNDTAELTALFTKGAVAGATMRWYLHTSAGTPGSAVPVGATLIATQTGLSASNNYGKLQRNLINKGAVNSNIICSSTAAINIDITVTSSGVTNVNHDFAVDQYFIVACQLASTGETATFQYATFAIDKAP